MLWALWIHLGMIIFSMAQTMWSQFLHKIARRVTAKKVQMIWKRLLIIGAINLAMVETHTRITVMKAKTTFIHFPSKTLALTVSDCRACCSCWWISSLETRVWQDSKASCQYKIGRGRGKRKVKEPSLSYIKYIFILSGRLRTLPPSVHKSISKTIYNSLIANSTIL